MSRISKTWGRSYVEHNPTSELLRYLEQLYIYHENFIAIG